MITNSKTIKYFPGLNELRFLAAFLVLIHHGATLHKKHDLGLHFHHWGIFNNGEYAVTFFFVLSGFLITYLLTQEQYLYQKVSVKKFYLKRILRIWPLYFLLVFIGVFILPLSIKYLNIPYIMPYSFSETWYYFIFFLPGLVTYFHGTHLLQPLWSIGVEEIFYILWAPLIKFFHQYLFNLLVVVFLLFLSLKFIGLIWIKNELFNYVMQLYRIETMAVGGLGAYLIFKKGNELNQWRIFKKSYQWIFLSLCILLMTFNHLFPILKEYNALKVIIEQMINFSFLYIIVLVAFIKEKVIHIKSRKLSYLGTISYGIYMYHMLVIFLVIHLCAPILKKMPNTLNFILYYSLIIGLTLLVSFISKKYFEDLFLRFRPKKATTIKPLK